VINETLAIAIQTYYTKFAITGNPNEDEYPFFPEYGPNSTLLNLNITGINHIADPGNNARCQFW
jgi:hypothetical protein